MLVKTNQAASALLDGHLGPLAAELRDVYDTLQVPVNEKKSVKSSLQGEMQGGLVNGMKGTISPKLDKVARYLRGAWYLLQSNRVGVPIQLPQVPNVLPE